MLRTIEQSLMVHARVSEAHIHFAVMYKTDNIFPVIPIKYLINKDGGMTMAFKPSTGKKPSVSHLRALFCPCIVHKDTAHVGTKALNMRHQAQNSFCSILVGIPQHQKVYLVYVPHRRRIISLYSVVFDEIPLVRWRIRHNYMQNLWLCDRPCHTYLMLHIQWKKLVI